MRQKNFTGDFKVASKTNPLHQIALVLGRNSERLMMMVTSLFLYNVQLFRISVLSKYLGRAFIETKDRTLYLPIHYHPACTELGHEFVEGTQP